MNFQDLAVIYSSYAGPHLVSPSARLIFVRMSWITSKGLSAFLLCFLGVQQVLNKAQDSETRMHLPATPMFIIILLLQNVPLGFFVTQIKAKDGDEGVNGEVMYELVPNPTNAIQDWEKFRIDEITGQIFTNAEMDRETQETYYVSIFSYFANLQK